VDESWKKVHCHRNSAVRARLVQRAEDWRWSSVHARIDDFAALLRAGEDEAASMALRRAETTGRPLGDGAFPDRVKAVLGRNPEPGKRGRSAAELCALSP
jgi:putative transposase